MTRRWRFPMFLKFLVGCFTLATLLIVGGTFVVQNETRLRNRGNYLAKHLRRYLGYQERVGRGMTGTLEVLANEEELQTAILGAQMARGQGGDAAARALAAHAAEHRDEPAAPGGAGSTHMHADTPRSMYEELSTKNSVQPDLFAVFTADNHLVWTPPGSPLHDSDLDELAPIDRARGGSAFAHKPVLFDGVAYQVSALPVRNPDNQQVVGGILAGVKLERYFDEWAEQSDDDADARVRPTLLAGPEILASAHPEERWPELAKAMQPDKFLRVKVGDDVRDVVRTKGGDLDFYYEELDGWKGLDKGSIGRIFLTRSRTNLVDPGSKIPWVEIGIGGLLSVVIASMMAFWITRPIKQFVRQSRDLLQGDTDLTQRIVVSSRDETADLAENINQVFARLHRLAGEVQSAAFQVGASSAEISAASKQTLAGLRDGTVKIEGSTAAVTELSASIQQVADNAAQATDVAEKSNVAVASAVQRMSEIRTSVEDAGDKMRDLGESSKRIGNIVEVIRQISEQTSLLALNASIEAAHAGEQGRGFAVVADEVSSLARRVGQSAKDIEALIQTIKEQTGAAMSSMEVGTREVENGTSLVTATLTDLGKLISVVKDTAHAVQEQAVVSDEIARNMDAIQKIAGEVLSGSEESVVQAERLHELAFALEESIGGFNLDGSEVKRPPPRGNGRGRDARAIAEPRAPVPPERTLGRGQPSSGSRTGASPLDRG